MGTDELACLAVLTVPLFCTLFACPDQLRASDIHFERKLCAVSDSKQGLRNATDRLPHVAILLVGVGKVRSHNHLDQSVSNMMVKKGDFQSSPDGSLPGLFQGNRRKANDDQCVH